MKYSQSVREMSLVEQKKLQWAKEKEELAKLNEIYATTTATHPSSIQHERTSIRTYYSNGDLTSNSNSNSNTLPWQPNRYNDTFNLHKNAINYNGNSMMIPNKRINESDRCRAYAADFYIDNNGHYHANDNNNTNYGSMANDANKQQNYYKENSIRSPMLPPIERRTTNRGSNQMRMCSMNPNHDEDTSGYLSDSSNFVYLSSDGGLSNGLNGMRIVNNKSEIPHRSMVINDDVEYNESKIVFNMPKTPTSMCSENNNYLSVNHPLYRKEKEERAKWDDRNSHLYDSVSKESGSSIKSDGPCWLERNLADSGDESVKSYSFIRGQNAPIDPNILAERTTKRLKALEFQNAIKAQVEERERLRKFEHEQMLAEESRREHNLRQQLELNERRIEEEQQKLRERIENEQRKQEMMRIAIEKAREAADAEKSRRKRSIQSNDNLNGQHCEQTVIQTDESKRQSNPMSIDHRWENNKDDHHQTSTMDGSDEMINSTNNNAIDDGEQILIGSPIRMKKKTLNKATKPMQMIDKDNNDQDNELDKMPMKNGTMDTNIDGIAFVLQTLPPIMPILSNDIINLNQNINNLNTSNIQLAVMLAHLQQLNSMAQNQMPDLLQAKMTGSQLPFPSTIQTNTMPKLMPVTMTNKTTSMEILSKNYNVNGSTESHSNDKNGNENENEKPNPNNNQDNNNNNNLCMRCNQSSLCCSLLSMENLKEIDGNNDIRMSTEMDRGQNMVTNDIIDLIIGDNDAGINNNGNHAAINHNNNNNPPKDNETNHDNDQHDYGIDDTKQMLSVSTQTDKKIEVEVCFQCHYHECHHHHVIVKDLESDCDDSIKTIAINHHHSNGKIKECSINEKDTTIEQNENDSNDTCTTVSTSDNNNNNLDNIKDGKMPIKIEDRPKWGVNRPIQQYIKASERDPFYLRNKQRKKERNQQIDIYKSCNDTIGHTYGNEDDDDDDDDDNSRSLSRAISPSPSIITNCTVTLNSPIHKSMNPQQQQQQQQQQQKLQSSINQKPQMYQQQPSQHQTSSKRNICTEILPIKTDINGRVYLNFREASLIMSEDEVRQMVKPSSSHRNTKIKRITNRCRTMHDIHSAPHQIRDKSSRIGSGNSGK